MRTSDKVRVTWSIIKTINNYRDKTRQVNMNKVSWCLQMPMHYNDFQKVSLIKLKHGSQYMVGLLFSGWVQLVWLHKEKREFVLTIEKIKKKKKDLVASGRTLASVAAGVQRRKIHIHWYHKIQGQAKVLSDWSPGRWVHQKVGNCQESWPQWINKVVVFYGLSSRDAKASFRVFFFVVLFIIIFLLNFFCGY